MDKKSIDLTEKLDNIPSDNSKKAEEPIILKDFPTIYDDEDSDMDDAIKHMHNIMRNETSGLDANITQHSIANQTIEPIKNKTSQQNKNESKIDISEITKNSKDIKSNKKDEKNTNKIKPRGRPNTAIFVALLSIISSISIITFYENFQKVFSTVVLYISGSKEITFTYLLIPVFITVATMFFTKAPPIITAFLNILIFRAFALHLYKSIPYTTVIIIAIILSYQFIYLINLLRPTKRENAFQYFTNLPRFRKLQNLIRAALHFTPLLSILCCKASNNGIYISLIPFISIIFIYHLKSRFAGGILTTTLLAIDLMLGNSVTILKSFFNSEAAIINSITLPSTEIFILTYIVTAITITFKLSYLNDDWEKYKASEYSNDSIVVSSFITKNELWISKNIFGRSIMGALLALSFFIPLISIIATPTAAGYVATIVFGMSLFTKIYKSNLWILANLAFVLVYTCFFLWIKADIIIELGNDLLTGYVDLGSLTFSFNLVSFSTLFIIIILNILLIPAIFRLNNEWDNYGL